MVGGRFVAAVGFCGVGFPALGPTAFDDRAALVRDADALLGLRVADALPALRVRDLAAGARFLAGALVPDVADAPDDTRVECLARGRTGFLGGAASATDAAAKATSSAATRTLRLRIMALR